MAAVPFETVLVADRGVMGARVVRAVQALGARAVTVHLDGEKGFGDESVLLGGPGSDADVVKVVEAARQCGADAVHPGAGPLAADPGLARAVLEAGLVWIGAPPEHLGATPVLPASRSETQCLDGVPIDVREVHDGCVRSVGVGSSTVAAPAGFVTLVGDVVVPHLTVEHVVTEEALGVDLVALQLRTAAGEDVPFELVRRPAVGVVLRGHGVVTGLRWPDGVRVETGCHEGQPVPYDGIVAVLACAAATAEEAVARLQTALSQTVIEGATVTVPDLGGTSL